MAQRLALGSLCVLVAVASAAIEVRNLNDLQRAKRENHKHVIVRDIHVPAGVTLSFEGLNGSTIEFAGRVTFGYKEWYGPLMILKGSNLNIQGKSGHLIDGQGQRWWDTLGGNGGKVKPSFIYVQLENSYVKGLKSKNSPAHGYAINDCFNLHMSHLDFDNSDGHTLGGHNTDGFDIAGSRNVRISDSKVNNQDDCLAMNSGTDIVFSNNVCIGGHGIAVAVGGYKSNEARNILIENCKVISNTFGIRVKTLLNGKGIVDGVTFRNIDLKDISEMGIVVIGNYLNSGARGDPTPGIPIKNLNIKDVRGNVLGNGTNNYVWVAPGSSSNWNWQSSVRGGKKLKPCKGIPKGINIECGK